MDGQSLEQGQRLAGKLVALGLLFADGEQADAGLGDFENAAGVHLAHHGELLKILRFAIDVGAYVEQHAWVAF